MTWNVANQVQDTAPDASILSLATDANGNVYGSGEDFGASGNLEGSFSANQTNGDINWIEDCHGDTYSVSPSPVGFLYAVGHAHYCGNIGGFPQTSPRWTYHRALAFTEAATGWVQHNTVGSYHDWAGFRSPSLVDWFPDLTVGTITGKTQAAWSVASNSKYVVLGGEFPKVNGQAQQGLVRFAVQSASTNKRGPQLYSAADTDPSVVSADPGHRPRVDPDQLGPGRHGADLQGLPRLAEQPAGIHVDAELDALEPADLQLHRHRTHTGPDLQYKVVVSDPDGNKSQSPDWVPVTVVGSKARSANVLGAGPPSESGSQATHTNPSSSPTVTDNDGQATSTPQVTIPAGTVAADAFSRSATNQWGSADVGGPWTISGSSSCFSVDGAAGKMLIPPNGATDAATLNSVSQQNVNMLVDVRPDQLAAGSGLYSTLVARRIGTSDYRLTARLMPGGVVHLTLAKVVNGTLTTFGEQNISGLTYTAGDVLRIRFTALTAGASTALSGTIWKSSGPEPAAPQVTATDSTAGLQAPGAVGLITHSGPTGTAPITATYDNLSVKTA